MTCEISQITFNADPDRGEETSCPSALADEALRGRICIVACVGLQAKSTQGIKNGCVLDSKNSENYDFLGRETTFCVKSSEDKLEPAENGRLLRMGFPRGVRFLLSR